MQNRYWLLYFSILAAILAGCYPTATPAVLPVSTATSAPADTATPVDTGQPTEAPPIAVVTAGGLYVHAGPDAQSIVTGYLLEGDVVTLLECVETFCKIEQPFGYVWRGCLSDNPEGLGCEEK